MVARPHLTEYWNFKKLSRRLQSCAAARGHLELLWDTAKANGNLFFSTFEDVEAAANWSLARSCDGM